MNDVAPLSPDRLTARLEHLMTETENSGVPRRFRNRRYAVVTALILGVGAGTAGVVAAQDPAVTRQDNGVVRIDDRALLYSYNGRTIGDAELAALQRAGKAQVTVSSLPTACRGIVLVFDTQAEADAWGRDYIAATHARPAGASTSQNPCASG